MSYKSPLPKTFIIVHMRSKYLWLCEVQPCLYPAAALYKNNSYTVFVFLPPPRGRAATIYLHSRQQTCMFQCLLGDKHGMKSAFVTMAHLSPPLRRITESLQQTRMKTTAIKCPTPRLQGSKLKKIKIFQSNLTKNMADDDDKTVHQVCVFRVRQRHISFQGEQ